MKAIHPMLSYIVNTRFFMTRDSFQSMMVTLLADPDSFFIEDTPTYEDNSVEIADKITSVMAGIDPNINLTRSFKENDIPVNSIAYHRIFGPIIADDDYCRWYFSTKQFIKAPNIIGFITVDFPSTVITRPMIKALFLILATN